MNEPLYRIRKKSPRFGDVEFQPALPNDKLMEQILNNKDIMMNQNAGDIMKKVIDMEWKYLERRIIKWLGDTPTARKLQSDIKQHIKEEKKWIAKGAKVNAI